MHLLGVVSCTGSTLRSTCTMKELQQQLYELYTGQTKWHALLILKLVVVNNLMDRSIHWHISKFYQPYVCHHSFLPEASFGLRVLSLPACVCVCLSVNHQLVRAVTHQPFKLESPNLDQRCKRPWLRSLLFFEMIDLQLQGQIEL